MCKSIRLIKPLSNLWKLGFTQLELKCKKLGLSFVRFAEFGYEKENLGVRPQAESGLILDLSKMLLFSAGDPCGEGSDNAVAHRSCRPVSCVRQHVSQMSTQRHLPARAQPLQLLRRLQWGSLRNLWLPQLLCARDVFRRSRVSLRPRLHGPALPDRRLSQLLRHRHLLCRRLW